MPGEDTTTSQVGSVSVTAALPRTGGDQPLTAACVSPDKDRQTVFITLTVISLVGCFLFFLLRKPDPDPAPSEATEGLLQADQLDSIEGSR